MLLVAPLREELLFRGVILTIARERCVARARERERDREILKRSRACLARRGRRLGDSPYRERLAALTSTACFSVIHLMNAGAGRYSMDYVALQVVLGFVMGLFFALRALQTRSLWETAALHLVNNVFASMLPFDVEVDLRDPIFALPLLQTLVTYALLDAHLWRKVDQAARASD
jgi:membrane protease YdiL (CAAX protease family)